MAKGIKGSGPTEDVPSRTSFLIKPTVTAKLKYIALMDKTTQTELIDKQLNKLISEWEKKNGPIPIK